MLGAAIAAAVAAFGLLVAGLVTGQVWFAIACVVAAAIGLVLLVIDIRRVSRVTAIEEAPTTGAFLGEDVEAFVAAREARRDTGAFAAVAGTGGLAIGGGFREPEPDFTGPLRLGQLGATEPAVPNPAVPNPAVPSVPPPPAPPARPAVPPTFAFSDEPAAGASTARPAFTIPTVSSPPPRPPAPAQAAMPGPADPTRPAPRPVGDLHDYVASTGSIPRVETSGAIPAVTEPGAIRWETSIPPSGQALVSDQSREAMRHVNDLPAVPPTPRRPRTDESPRAKRLDPLDPDWHPPLD